MFRCLLIALLMLAPSCADARFIHGKPVVASGPVLSAQIAQADGTDWFGGQATTDTGSGTLYWCVSTTNGLSPTAAQVKACTVSGHVLGNSQAVSSSGVQTINDGPALSAVTNYTAYYVQNSTGGDSNVVGTAQFKTPGVLAFSVTATPAFTAAQGGALVAPANAVLAQMAACFAPALSFTANVGLDSNSGSCSGGCLGFTTQTGQLTTNSYSTQIKPALIALPGKNAIQHTLFDNPPATDPTGLGDNWWLNTTLNAGIGLGSFNQPQDWATSYNPGATYDPSTTAGCGGAGFCFGAVSRHEFTEGAGRFQLISFNGQATMVTFSSYSAPGTRSSNEAINRYPSIDAGTTNMISPFFYEPGSSGDPMDWTASGTDDFTGNYSGGSTNFTCSDVKTMTAGGFPLTHACRASCSIGLFP